MKDTFYPLISIIVPVYNTAQFLSQCVQSITKQTYTNLEIILIDDGSPDEAPGMCDHFASQDQRIKVIHQSNGGLSNARNKGMEMASGEYFGFVDSDDWIAPDMYAYLYHHMTRNQADIAICPHFRVTGEQRKPFPSNPEFKVLTNIQGIRLLAERKAFQNYFCDKLFKREVFTGINFPEGRIFEDLATMYKVMYKARKIVLTTCPKYFYRIHPSSISQQYRSQPEKEFQVLQGFHEQYMFGRENHIWEKAPLKAFRTCIHFINHTLILNKKEEVQGHLVKALDIMHQYDHLPLREVGFSLAVKRYLIYHHFPIYSSLYRQFNRLSGKRK